MLLSSTWSFHGTTLVFISATLAGNLKSPGEIKTLKLFGKTAVISTAEKHFLMGSYRIHFAFVFIQTMLWRQQERPKVHANILMKSEALINRYYGCQVLYSKSICLSSIFKTSNVPFWLFFSGFMLLQVLFIYNIRLKKTHKFIEILGVLWLQFSGRSTITDV